MTWTMGTRYSLDFPRFCDVRKDKTPRFAISRNFSLIEPRVSSVYRSTRMRTVYLVSKEIIFPLRRLLPRDKHFLSAIYFRIAKRTRDIWDSNVGRFTQYTRRPQTHVYTWLDRVQVARSCTMGPRLFVRDATRRLHVPTFRTAVPPSDLYCTYTAE